ncbi:MAG: DinB family protein [Acidobacteriales bacterium]|nr:DinB family protein [Terriglobales bacterium]
MFYPVDESVGERVHPMPQNGSAACADRLRALPAQGQSMTSSDRYRRWFEYEKESHAKVLQSLEAVPLKQRSLPGFQRALTLMAHMVAARRIWLFRFGVAKDTPREFFPQRVDLGELRSEVERMHQAWSDYLRSLNDLELARKFEYRSTEGAWFRSSVEDVLTQLFGHSLYHRGQIAALLRSIGVEPPITDFVFWSRQPITAPEGE